MNVLESNNGELLKKEYHFLAEKTAVELMTAFQKTSL